MAKVTYLLGAGASNGGGLHEAMPLVSDFSRRLIKFRDALLDDLQSFNDAGSWFRNNFGHEMKDYSSRLQADTLWILNSLQNHQSIDTFAKKLSTQGEIKKLDQLKKILSMFFIYEQYRLKPDMRYDSFIASLIDPNSRLFPKSVRVLTWNYDCQLELSLMNFLNLDNINDAIMRLQVIPNIITNGRMDFFSVHKLNGTAGALNSNNSINSPFQHPAKHHKSIMEYIMTMYAIPSPPAPELNQSTSIKFAWENEPTERAVTNSAIDNTYDTNVLVVIGYSFPFFNRSVDQNIIRKMDLSEVYIQAPEPYIHNDIASFKAIRNDINPVPIKMTTQFFLPPELTL